MNKYSTYTNSLTESTAKIEYTEGSKSIKFSGTVVHNTSEANAKAIRSSSLKPSRGMLDTGIYCVDGNGKETSAVSNEVSIELTIKLSQILQVKDVGALMKFVSANCPGKNLDEGITALGFKGIRLEKPYTTNASPWVVIYDTSVIIKVSQ